MKSENFVIIQGWMCNELELKGNDLLVYALIYGFSQDGESKFSGSRNYIADTFNISKPTVDKALQSLLDRGYISKHISEDITEPNMYWANLDVVKKLYWGVVKKLYSIILAIIQIAKRRIILKNYYRIQILHSVKRNRRKTICLRNAPH